MRKLLYVAVMAMIMSGTASAADNRVDGLRPDAPELATPGNNAIGVRTLELVNKGQVDILKVEAGKPLPQYDRPLTVEVWYPSDGTNRGGEYKDVYIRDGQTRVTLYGQAVRDAAPAKPAQAAGSEIRPRGDGSIKQGYEQLSERTGKCRNHRSYRLFHGRLWRCDHSWRRRY